MSYSGESAYAHACRYAHVWLPGYVRSRVARWRSSPCKRVWVMFADHFEPCWADAPRDQARARVQRWSDRWPRIAAAHQDSAGRPPRYTFFYAQEQYHPELLDALAQMTRAGVADVEVHVHHDGEGEQDFVDRIGAFIDVLYHRHGLLRRTDNRTSFGFIHGDWALDNSGPRGRHCGLNNELLLLKQLGCYADFTFPAVPHPSQPRLVNTIYWATDDPQRPKSYDTGVPVAPGIEGAGDLMIVPGPLALNWRGRRLVPRIETGELAAGNPVTAQRMRLWLQSAPKIGGDVFVKLFAHGAKENNADALLRADLPLVLQEFERTAKQSGIELYYVSAWEMRRAIESIERGTDPIRSLLRVSTCQTSSTGGRD
jgi:hypothetical protein